MSSQSPREESGTGPAAAADDINNNHNHPNNNTGAGDMGRAGDGDKGGRLTEEEKKQNHIASGMYVTAG